MITTIILKLKVLVKFLSKKQAERLSAGISQCIEDEALQSELRDKRIGDAEALAIRLKDRAADSYASALVKLDIRENSLLDQLNSLED
jgi:hypothetical protein